MRLRLTIVLLPILLAGGAAAQVPADSVRADTAAIARAKHVPRNAFIKSMLVPGWGHFSIGSEGRGFFYVALQGSSWYMLLKTLGTLGDAQDRERKFVGVATDSLNALMATDTAAQRRLSDPVVFEQAVGAHPDVSRLRGLVRAREQQRQDWITYTLFFTFLSAVDAYVTAHMADFPGDITATPGRDGSLSLRVDLPLPARGRR